MTGFLVAGLVAAALVRLLNGPQNLNLLVTLLVGIVGSAAGGLLANAVGTASWFEFNFLGFVVAVGSAVLLLGVSERTARVRER